MIRSVQQFSSAVALVSCCAALLSLSPANAAAEFARGEVRRINPSTATVTLRHEPIKSHDMPAMTMDFKVKDPEVLKSLKKGDAVEFTLDQDMTVTQMRKPAQ